MATCVVAEPVDVLSNMHLEMHYFAIHVKQLAQVLKSRATFYRVAMEPLLD
jgi:hypothetical protein